MGAPVRGLVQRRAPAQPDWLRDAEPATLRTDVDILQARHRLYEMARSQTPSRWSGNTRNWQPITRVTLNPERDSVAQAATNPCDNGQVAA